MAKKQNKSTGRKKDSESAIFDMGFLPHELKKQCIKRGLPFEDVVNMTHPDLNLWLRKNFSKPIQKDKLYEFDQWLSDILKERDNENHAFLCHPLLQMAQIEEESKPKLKKVKKKKEKKPRQKRVKDENGRVKGTKKALVFDAVRKGRSEDFIRKRLKKKFGEFNENSLKLWISKAKRQYG